MKYKVIKGDNCVSICMDCDSELDSFIDIFSNDYDTPSPFASVGVAYAFALIIVNMLEIIYGFKQ